MWSKVCHVDFGTEPLGFVFGVDKNDKVAILKFENDTYGLPGQAEKSGKIAEGSIIVSLNYESTVRLSGAAVMDRLKALREMCKPLTIGFYNEDSVWERIRAAAAIRMMKPAFEDDSYSPLLLEGEQFFCIMECQLKEYLPSISGEIVSRLRPSKLFMTNYR